jgi:hypothetical protein
VTVALLSLLLSQWEGHKGKYKRVTVFGSWHVPSYVAVRRGMLKPNCDTLSGKPPRGRVGLLPPGCLAFSPSSLGLSQSARVLA